MTIRINTLIEIIIVAFLFFSLNPFVLWIIWPGLINLPLFMLVMLATLQLAASRQLSITLPRLAVAFCFILFCLYSSVPIAGHNWDVGKIIYFTSAAAICFFPSIILLGAFTRFKSLLTFFCLIALLVFFLTLIGLELPYYKIPAFSVVMTSLDAYYKLYGVVVSSTNTIYHFSGITIARICGPFLEPGHFSIYLGLVAFIEKVRHNKNSPILLITAFLTFSPAAVFFIALILGYNWLTLKGFFKSVFPISALMMCAVAGFFTLDDSLQENIRFLIVERNFGSEDFSVASVLDERAGKTSLPAYEAFKKTQDVYTGKGVHALEELGVLSDMRGLIFKYGLIGLYLSLFLWACIFFQVRQLRLLLAMTMIVVLIGAHRSWMFESVFVYIILFMGIQIFNFERFRDRNSVRIQ